MDIRILVSLFILYLLPILPLQAAPSSNFVRVPFGNGASIEVPKNWSVLSGNQRVMIDTFVEAKGYRLSESTLSFAANLYDDRGKTLAVVNTHLYPENPLTQDQVKALSASDIQALDQQIRSVVEATQKAIGMHVTKWYGSKIKVVGGMRAFVHEHQQSDTGSKNVVRSRSIRLLASPRSFTVTLSYRESESVLLLPIINRMESSISLD